MSRKVLSAFPYYGGKAALAPVICDMLDYSHANIFIEPFGGGARVLLNKPRHPVEIYNDASAGLCAFMRCMSDPQTAREVIRRLYDTEYTPETFYAAVRLRNLEEDDYFEEVKRQFKQYLSELNKRHPDAELQLKQLRRNINQRREQMDFTPLEDLLHKGSLTEQEITTLQQFRVDIEEFLRIFQLIYQEEERLSGNRIAAEVTETYLKNLAAELEKAEDNTNKKAHIQKRIQAIKQRNPEKDDANRIIKAYLTQLYQSAYANTQNNHEVQLADDVSLAAATWIVYTMSRDGMGKAFTAQRFRNNDQYLARVGTLYDVAERMKGVQVTQVGALSFLKNQRYLHNPYVCFYLDPSYLEPENGKKNLGETYKLSWGREDHKLFLKTIQKVHAKIVVSNYDNDLYNQYLISNDEVTWKKYEFETTTSVGGVAGNVRKEIIWKNF